MMTDRIEIESGIPVPVRGEDRIVYPFHKMKPGDSFLVDKEPTKMRLNTMYGLARRRKCRITIRREGKGFRVWYLGPRENSSNWGANWSAEEDIGLVQMVENGSAATALVDEFERTFEQISFRCAHLRETGRWREILVLLKEDDDRDSG